MSKEVFLTNEEEQEIVAAISMAEKETSGEIRVHIEKTTSKVPYDRALEVFHLLKMDETQLKNGVLIYLAVDDKGIHDSVGDDFWESTKNAMAVQFKNGDFKQGLIDGIVKAGNKLSTYFPYEAGDTNELSNEISKG